MMRQTHATPPAPLPPGHHYNRVLVIMLGAALAGATAMGFALASSVLQGAALWALNGAGLALVLPAAQSLVAECSGSGRAARRGGALLGGIGLAGSLGAVAGALYATNVGTWGQSHCHAILCMQECAVSTAGLQQSG
jgi:MFS family permease